MGNPDFSQMTRDEVEAWEKAQDNSNDLYKVAARVKNLARDNGGSLTHVGDILCNSYVHVLLALYKFAENLQDEDTKNKLVALIRSHESLPRDIINAAMPKSKK